MVVVIVRHSLHDFIQQRKKKNFLLLYSFLFSFLFLSVIVTTLWFRGAIIFFFFFSSLWNKMNAYKAKQKKDKYRAKVRANVEHQFGKMRLHSACFFFGMYAKWIFGSSKMSRYLNYGKSFIIAIITNANFRHIFFSLSLHGFQALCSFLTLFFTIFPM